MFLIFDQPLHLPPPFAPQRILDFVEEAGVAEAVGFAAPVDFH